MANDVKPNYEIRVGIFALFALILLVWGWSWLKSFNLFHAPQRFVVRFHDVAGMNNNATVNINGVRVGTIEKVELISKGEVNCHLRITADNVVVPVGSTATIQTLGLVGAKYLEITLPELSPGEPQPAPLTDNDVVIGQDPVRVELVLNDMATKLSKIFHTVKTDKASKSIASVLENSGEAVRNIKEASEKLNSNMDRFTKVAESVQSTAEKFGSVAEKAEGVESSAQRFFSHGTNALDGVQILTNDLHGTTKKFNKLLDNPGTSKDFKETIQQAKQTAEIVSRAMHELNSTISDPAVRQDIMSVLNRIDHSTDNIVKSLGVVKNMSADEGLRSDIKQIVTNAKQAMDKLDGIVSDPGFKNDIRTTITKVRSAAENVDLASRQLSSVLNKRAPLLHMMFGRPGQVPKEDSQPSNSKSSN